MSVPAFTPTTVLRHTARKEPKNSERSGIRTRQTSGIFSSGFCINGREGDGYNTRKGKKSADCVRFLASRPPRVLRLRTLPRGHQRLTQEHAMYQPPLPQVVEFGHHYDVKIERDGNFTRVTASIKATQYTSTYKKIHDLPFCALDPSSQTWKFWSFPKAANTEEATVRGRYFWEEFVRFTRGHQKKRRAEALYSLRHSIFPAICKNWGDESGVFMDQLCETVIDSLRVGVE